MSVHCATFYIKTNLKRASSFHRHFFISLIFFVLFYFYFILVVSAIEALNNVSSSCLASVAALDWCYTRHFGTSVEIMHFGNLLLKPGWPPETRTAHLHATGELLPQATESHLSALSSSPSWPKLD